MKLSPLNLIGALHTLGLVIVGRDATAAGSASADPRMRNRAIECWRCPVCHDVHDDQTDAELCCAPKLGLHHEESAVQCPVCAEEHGTHRDAADCCLWKDLDAPTRWAVADAVEAGTPWAEALGLNGGRL